MDFLEEKRWQAVDRGCACSLKNKKLCGELFA